MSIKTVITSYAGALTSGIVGGWKTLGNGIEGTSIRDWGSGKNDPYEAVSLDQAMKLSAVMACATLRAETIASMPLHIRDKDKNTAVDHDLYYLLHDSPNYAQTNIEYTSADIMRVDMLGNSYSVIHRRRDKTVKSLEPISNSDSVELRKDGARLFYIINGEEYAGETILHQKGVSLDGYVGLSRLAIGRNILSGQVMANETAARAFKNSLKIGGFIKTPVNSKAMTDEQYKQFQARMAQFNAPENQSRFMPLPPGFEPLDAIKYRMSMADAELMASRYFGIEEICRLFNVPPPLIGHTDKASSWASSVEALNMHFLMYSLAPTLIRREKRYAMQLLSPEERRRFYPKYSAEGLLRVDTKSRYQFYASALQNGYLNINEVRDMEDRAGIGAFGDEFRVQLNMAKAQGENNGNQVS